MRQLPLIAFAASLAVLIGVVVFWSLGEKTDQDQDHVVSGPLVVHTAASLRLPMEKAAAEFERTSGLKIELRFGSSESLLNNLKLKQKADLFLPADNSYVDLAREAGLVEQSFELARMQGVALFSEKFAKDHPTIGWNELLAPSFRLVLANPDGAAIGKLTREALRESGTWAKIEAKNPPLLGTITEAANAVKLGSADGTFVFDAVAKQYPNLKVVNLPGLENVNARVTVAVCKESAARTEARKFATFLEKADGGQVFFQQAGFTGPELVRLPEAKGANPEDNAEITLYAGSMLRPAIEATIEEFEKQEHVRVTRVYNGCGILVGQMRTGKSPDLYFACDPRFMGEVEDLFLKPMLVSNNQLVIAVPKGNPAGLKELKDLGKEGLRVGVGHEQQCALGAITKESFIKSGVYGAVRKNVQVESPTGDLLVNQLMTGSLDAVVCYVSNVAPNTDRIEGIPVLGIPCAAPQQPVAIAKDSKKQALAAKLIEYIQSKESRQRFEKLGFGWEGKEPKK